MRLIIPAAKIVPEELQMIGKLPGIIYPINKKIVFDYLYEQYKKIVTSFDIVCYENYESVERYLSRYKDERINIQVLSELRDLGYTIYQSIKEIEDSVIINFSDTIVLDNIFDCVEDSFFCQKEYMSETWTYFDDQNGVITDIYDKTSANSEQEKKFFVGVFKFSDSKFLKECLEKAFENKDRKINSFYYALQLYSQHIPMQAVMTDNWFDIGHVDNYYNSQLEVKAREFNHITIDKDRGILRKTSDEREKFIGEIEWYLKLPSDVEYVRPRIFDYSTSYEFPFVTMEYYAYHTLHELFLYGDLSLQQWTDVFNRIRFVCRDFKRYCLRDKGITLALEDMYLTKTMQRFEILRRDSRFSAFFDKTIKVNGSLFPSLNKIESMLQRVVPELLYDVDTFVIIHGDLCFTNILVDSNFSFIKLIDPRGKFGNYDIYGDERYELAKLLHSIDGKYDYIIKDLFDVSYSYDLDTININYTIHNSNKKYDLYKLFCEIFKAEIGNHIKKIELIEALLFFSMIPLHNESFDQQMVMLGTGLEIFNRVVIKSNS